MRDDEDVLFDTCLLLERLEMLGGILEYAYCFADMGFMEAAACEIGMHRGR